MIKPPDEAPSESLGPESTAKSSNNSHTDRQEDNWQNLDKEEADNQNDHSTANQVDGRVSSEAVPNIFGQTDHKLPEHIAHRTSDETDLQPSHHDDVADHRTADWVDQTMSEQMDNKSSHQADHVESEQTDSQMPVLYKQRTSEHRLMSSPAESRAYKQNDDRLSMSFNRRASEQTDYRIPGQAQGRTSKQIDSTFSSLIEQKTYEQLFNHRLSDQTGYKTLAKTHHIVHDQASEQAEHQAADQTDSSAHQLTVEYSESDQADHLMYNKAYDTKDHWFDYGERDQYGGRTFTSKEDRNADFRIQPCKFEVSQTDLNNSKVASTTDNESGNFLQALNSLDTKFISNFQAPDLDVSPRFPSISTNLDYIINQEKIQVTETKPDDISEYQEGESSHAHNETYRRRFPSIVYQDPYQISLQYMEKHHILQIFQITENLVYERPEDPLSFMLFQVWNRRKITIFLFCLV
uniref:Testis expressed 55 n=1 Tax=Rhinolophus ferrumequinum TaxID=59479 RepID=A0A671DP42_RHIFE